MGYDIQIGKTYISREEIVIVEDIDTNTGYIKCRILVKLVKEYLLVPWLDFEIQAGIFINSYKPYIDKDAELDLI